MTTPELYLITPRQLDAAVFGPVLARIFDQVPVACVRLSLDSSDVAVLEAVSESLLSVCDAADVPLVISEHYRLARRLGLNGVHLDGTKNIRAAREAMAIDAIVGSFCGTSRHAGLTAGEIGADYVSFGPLSDSGLGDDNTADPDLFEWWSQMIEVPVVAEGFVTPEALFRVRGSADFIALGDEIWGTPDPITALKSLIG